eukprot:TRINITY_DN2038_c0_g1_i17.p1 TRINITY_DN2038_c0_g1~~TRINITY_DN2038_c0_g1_i17.p1  ORF type:complete len:375 (-),score=52.33 TRINITY_DN2038_c0_g1_i17:72-1196(-)
MILDLDETIVHSTFEDIDDYNLLVPVKTVSGTLRVKVKVRPGAEAFLERMGKKYELVIFTASLPEYANPLLDMLDTAGAVSFRLFRDSCTVHEGLLVKDLSKIGRPLKDIVIVDNSELSYALQPFNALAISDFIDDMSDDQLTFLAPFLEFLADVNDVRPVEKWKEVFDKGRPFSYVNMKGEINVYEKHRGESGSVKRTLKFSEMSTKSAKLTNPLVESNSRDNSRKYSADCEDAGTDEVGPTFMDHSYKQMTIFHTFSEVQKINSTYSVNEKMIKEKSNTVSATDLTFNNANESRIGNSKSVTQNFGTVVERRRQSLSKAKTIDCSIAVKLIIKNGDVDLSDLADEDGDPCRIAAKSDRPIAHSVENLSLIHI